MPVKQAGGGDKAHFVGRAVLGQGFEINGQIGHMGSFGQIGGFGGLGDRQDAGWQR